MKLTKKEKRILRGAIDFLAYHCDGGGMEKYVAKNVTFKDVAHLLKKLKIKNPPNVTAIIKARIQEEKEDKLLETYNGRQFK